MTILKVLLNTRTNKVTIMNKKTSDRCRRLLKACPNLYKIHDVGIPLMAGNRNLESFHEAELYGVLDVLVEREYNNTRVDLQDAKKEYEVCKEESESSTYGDFEEDLYQCEYTMESLTHYLKFLKSDEIKNHIVENNKHKRRFINVINT